METIALFGGSFDPPHIGHEAIVKALLQLQEIDKVVIMPTFLNPFKSESHADAHLRLEWLQELFKEYKNVLIDAYEVTQKRKVPTIETVEYLLKKYKKIYLVVGADNLEKLHHWHKFEELKRLVTFIVATRDGITIPENFISLQIDESISSSCLRDAMDETKVPQACASAIVKYYKEKNATKN
jgi:nicotinate-nucleotide adenylyltransferase